MINHFQYGSATLNFVYIAVISVPPQNDTSRHLYCIFKQICFRFPMPMHPPLLTPIPLLPTLALLRSHNYRITSSPPSHHLLSNHPHYLHLSTIVSNPLHHPHNTTTSFASTPHSVCKSGVASATGGEKFCTGDKNFTEYSAKGTFLR